MNILFIHQNFPGQFKHLAPALAKLGHSVVAIGTNKPQYATPGVKVILHQPPIEKDAHKSLLPEISEMKLKMIRGRSVAKVLTLLKTNGFVPDVIYGHSGWGEILFVREVFPDVPLIVYAEYYYGTPGSDLNFDPEFSKYSIESIERIKIKNLHLVNGVLDADLAISPTHFQKDRHPEALQSKITVIHDGIESARFTPNEDASITLKNANRTFKPGDEIFTFVARELEPYRGYHILVRALPQILALRPEAHVVIVGGNGGELWRSSASWNHLERLLFERGERPYRHESRALCGASPAQRADATDAGFCTSCVFDLSICIELVVDGSHECWVPDRWVAHRTCARTDR